MGVFTVILTGGKFFLRSDILAIISYIREKHMRVFLITNGTLLKLCVQCRKDYHDMIIEGII